MAFEILFLIGRILIGLFYGMNGINHFTKHSMMVGYAKSKKVPLPQLAIPISGVLLLLGSLSMLTGLYPFVGLTFIVVFLVPTTLMMHNFWAAPQEQKMNEMIHFMKNLALLGSTLMFYTISTPWPLGLG